MTVQTMERAAGTDGVSTDAAGKTVASARTASTQTGGSADPRKSSHRKRRNKKLLYIGGGIALLTILTAIIIPISVHDAKQTRYNEGVTFLENEAYEEAFHVFSELGSFDDSPDMAAYAQNAMEYERAKAIMKAGQYEEATAVFDSLGAFQDAAALSVQCRQMQAYESAMELYEAGSYAEAKELFASAGNYQDAKELEQKCGAFINYEKAQELMENGEYEAAKELLSPLDASEFTDKDTLILECDAMPEYLEAEALLEAGQFYSAYVLFTELGSFRDAETLAQSCIAVAPDTGETYRNSDFIGSACSLTIQPPTYDGSRTYVKIYSYDGLLVSCIFIGEGDHAKIDLPAGEYILKAAYGYGPWFGEEDMFGDDGVYQVLTVSAENEVFLFERGYDYTLTLRNAGDNGDNVSTENENRGEF